MSRGVKDILVENCTFIGTDVGVRIKSALGRGGVVENITIRNIDMVNIKGEAVILTMGYVLNLLNRNETIAMDNEEDVPYFRNIDMDGIVCTDCKEFAKIEPLNGRPDTIKDVVINKQQFC